MEARGAKKGEAPLACVTAAWKTLGYNARCCWFLLLLSVFLFYIGKGHALLIDTNALNVDGKTYTAPAMMEVSLGGEAESMGPSERSMANVGGPSHKLKIEIFNDSGESEKVVEHSFSIPTFFRHRRHFYSCHFGRAQEAWSHCFCPRRPRRERGGAYGDARRFTFEWRCKRRDKRREKRGEKLALHRIVRIMRAACEGRVFILARKIGLTQSIWKSTFFAHPFPLPSREG